MLIDTHCHLTDERFDSDREEIISSLFQNGIERAIVVGYDPKSSLASYNLARKHDLIYCAVGTHPHDAKDFKDADLELYASLAKDEKTVAIGEIGLDYYYDLSPREVQKTVFAIQLEFADSLNLPVILHVRDAYEDTYEVLNQNSHYLKNGLLFHCYSGSAEMAKRYFKFDPYFSFGGSITFKNAKTCYDVLPIISKDRILFETDSPYLTPVPFRGKRNEPQYTKYAAKKAAEILSVDENELIDVSTINARRLFKKLK